MNLIHLGGAGIKAHESAYGFAGRMLGNHLFTNPDGTERELPAGVDKDMWDKAHGVLCLSIAYAADIIRLWLASQDEPIDEDEVRRLAELDEEEFDAFMSAEDSEPDELEFSHLIDHLGYAAGLPHLQVEGGNPLVRDDAWITQTARSIVEHHWLAIRILTSVLLDRDVDERTATSILSIEGPDGWTFID
ncbi:hypothetical protein [Marmoricola sp. RAF53]|uniref:hypothetical protein n=1 Tax=Marmoricola sp. RAF53 TaxID=3233059 RepID=UPI003F97D49B